MDSPLLTKTQREHLQADFGEMSESQQSRLRDRIIGVLNDFATVWRALPPRERKKLFRKASGGSLVHDTFEPDREDHDEFRYSLISLVAFIYSGQREIGRSREDFGFLIESAIAMAESEQSLEDAPTGDLVGGYFSTFSDVDVDVLINVDKRPSLQTAQHRLETRKELTDKDIAVLARHGELDEDDLDRLAGHSDSPNE